MGAYFKPLRRKIGLRTLILACVLAGGWIRSEVKFDCFSGDSGNATYRILSLSGSISFIRESPKDGMWDIWSSGNVSDLLPDGLPQRIEWQMKIAGFDFGSFKAHTGLNYSGRRVVYSFPYWSLVIPLTLLSAWLLLSKIREPIPQTEPAPSKA